jgi:hypothetical protein
MYVLNRDTGKPVYGIEERPVPASEVPGEQASPTQPIPVKPGPIARVSYKPEDIVTADDTTAEHAAFCKALEQRSGGFYNEGAVFAVPIPRRRCAAAFDDSVSRVGRRRQLGWHGIGSEPRLHLRQHDGRSEHRLD